MYYLIKYIVLLNLQFEKYYSATIKRLNFYIRNRRVTACTILRILSIVAYILD